MAFIFIPMELFKMQGGGGFIMQGRRRKRADVLFFYTCRGEVTSAAGFLEEKEIGGVGCFVECEVIEYSAVNDATMDML